MAYTTLYSPPAVNHHPNSSLLTVTSVYRLQFISPYKFTSSSSSSLSLISSLNSKTRRCRCGASSPRPPESGPPPGDQQDTKSGSIASFSRLQESIQIFFAVFFWMSLFFWSSVWDGRNNGRSDKGPRFWK